jgi:hypothetical protein
MRDDFKSILDQINALENSGVLKSIRALENNGVLRSIQENQNTATFKALNELENSAGMRAIREYESSPAVRMMREFDNSSGSQVMREFENSTAFRQLQAVQNSPVFKAIKSIENSTLGKSFSRLTDQLNIGRGAYTFSEAYEFIANEYEYRESNDQLGTLSEELSDRTNASPRDALSAEFYLNVLLALVLFLISQSASKEMENRLTTEIKELENVISDQYVLLDTADEHQYLTPDRPLNFRTGPSVDDEIISVISPKQKLREIERKKDWIKVEYFDYLKNENIPGWVHSKYIVRFIE